VLLVFESLLKRLSIKKLDGTFENLNYVINQSFPFIKPFMLSVLMAERWHQHTRPLNYFNNVVFIVKQQHSSLEWRTCGKGIFEDNE
jgi:hypothetical protein